MKDSLEVGLSYERQIPIDRERTIGFMGEELRIYSTPNMVRDIEHTCRDLLLAHHDSGEDTVGARVEVDHLGPTLAGQTVTVTARVTELALPRVSFEIEVRDEIELVGRAKHVRFVVQVARQGERLKRKADKVKAAGATPAA